MEASSAVPRIRNIDALRGVAAFMVFAFHCQAFAGFDKRTLPPLTVFGHVIDSLPNPLSFGASGVNLFFVISGFVLTHQRLQRLERGTQSGVVEYLRGRFARIAPPYWAALAISLFATAHLRGTFQPEGGATIFGSVISHVLFLHVFNQRTYLSLNSVLWSMGIEVQFYLAFPLLFAALRRFGPWRFAVAALALALAWRSAAWVLFKDAPYGGQISALGLWSSQLPGRIPEFAGGMTLAHLYADMASRRVIARWAGAAALISMPLAVWGRIAGPYWAVDALLGVFYTSLLAWAVFPERRLGAPGWLTRFGVMSYSFFLIHEPITDFIGPALGLRISSPYLAIGPILLLAGTACLLVTVVFYRWIELPASTWSRSVSLPRAATTFVERLSPQACRKP